MTTNRTPTPWIAEEVSDVDTGANGILSIVTRDVTIAEIPHAVGANTTTRIANAAFIVTACNAHDELVAALRAIVDAASQTGKWAARESAKRKAIDAARAALAKVTP